MGEALTSAQGAFPDFERLDFGQNAESVASRHSLAFEQLLQVNEKHAQRPSRVRKRARPSRYGENVGELIDIRSSDLLSGPAGMVIHDAKTGGEGHLLLFSVSALASAALSVLMLFNGTAVSSGFPLSYVAFALVSFGFFAGAAAEWRKKRLNK